MLTGKSISAQAVADRDAGDGSLSGVQWEVIALLVLGMTDEAVARRLGMTPRTVQRHVRRTMEQLGARSRMELGILLTRLQLVEGDCHRE